MLFIASLLRRLLFLAGAPVESGRIGQAGPDRVRVQGPRVLLENAFGAGDVSLQSVLSRITPFAGLQQPPLFLQLRQEIGLVIDQDLAGLGAPTGCQAAVGLP